MYTVETDTHTELYNQLVPWVIAIRTCSAASGTVYKFKFTKMDLLQTSRNAPTMEDELDYLLSQVSDSDLL